MNKNIYLLPTDKPSRLFYDISIDKLVLATTSEMSKWFDNKHIYVTSDLEIKEGDWILFQGVLTKALKGEKFSSTEKVVLTTDQDLINDGVQKIDDEFLEWFVKNPSCEFVEVKEVQSKLYVPIEKLTQYESQPKELQFEHSSNINECYYYKIIIPQEEPKQDGFLESIDKSINMISLANSMFAPEPKQETLEEAARNYANITHNRPLDEEERYYRDYQKYDGFIAGAKSDAARDYWFKQFKKK